MHNIGKTNTIVHNMTRMEAAKMKMDLTMTKKKKWKIMMKMMK